jgi:hypothetical protein
VAEQNSSSVDNPSAEFLATSGLVTMLGAVVAGVIAVVTLSGGNVAASAALGALAALSFAVSLACFAADSGRSEDGALPFPSWLRSDAEPAAELSALG